ncbi:integrase [Desulfosarcina ovata subsp. sediminis]|uniref:Integrase n=1 Tax=Desulfosarcina ovata subsp. sediminis TaxID=885957 RepID=A0A5K7ZDF3_9BACT|nr:site-specific integrase [Desulfosarcina ovata]BBO80218.1 integrase [Desulfosarcina ovata subsp. sediminis]
MPNSKRKRCAIRSPSYLLNTSRRGCYYFRMKVPLDLQERVGKKELRASLRTGYLTDARHKSMLIGGRVQQLFRKLRSGNGGYNDMTKLDKDKINEIIREYIKGSLEWEEDYKANLNRPLTDDALDSRVDFMESMEADMREALAKCDRSPVERDVKKLIEERGLDIEQGSEDYNILCREVTKANIDVLQVEQKRAMGDYSSPEEVVLMELIEGPQPPFTPQIQQPAQQTSATVKQAADAFFDEFNRDWKPRSRTDYQNVLDQIVSGFDPGTQLHTIDYNRVKAFRDGLRDGSLSKNGTPLSIARTNFFTATIKRIFDLAMKQDRNLDRINPADGLQLRDKRKVSEKRDVFTNDELKAIFVDSKEYGQDKHTKAANFWVPLLGLYTGARLDELCQILIEDVVQRDGMWCLDIRDDNAERKSVKTGERRIVPLHPFIIDGLGFPEFVQGIDKRKKRVFHELVYVNNRWGHGLGQWFGRFKKRVGIESTGGMKSFHSFRHTLINHLKQNEADPQYVKEFVGHKSGKDITWDLYGKAFKPATLMEKVVMKLDYPIDLSHLKGSRWVSTKS